MKREEREGEREEREGSRERERERKEEGERGAAGKETGKASDRVRCGWRSRGLVDPTWYLSGI